MKLLRAATELLEKAGACRPRWTAEQLLAHRLNCKPIELYVESPPINSRQAIQFQTDVAARATGVPLQYLLGSTEFYGREFLVGPGVFIPRLETEILIEVVLELLPRQATVMDVGTGSGAIAVTLALERPRVRSVGIDRSSHALSSARRNADRHHAAVTFIQGDLLHSLSEETMDLIVANLPYLDPSRASDWPRELHWEPWAALDGGEAGLSLIQKLIGQSAFVLKPGGSLVLEIGAGQAALVSEFARTNGFKLDRVVPDLSGFDRVAVLKSEKEK